MTDKAQSIKAASVYASTEFRMDRKSWDHLDRFAKKIDYIHNKFKKLSSVVATGTKKINKASRAEQLERLDLQFNNKMGRMKLAPEERAKYLKDFSELKRRYEETGMSSFKLRTEMMKLDHQMRSQGKSVLTLNDRYRRLRRSLINLTGAYSVFLGIGGVATTGKQFESAETLFETLFPENAANEMQFLRGEADRLGMNLLDATKAYAKFTFSATEAGVTLQETREIYTAFSEASVVMGLTQDEVAKSFKAIIQMFSKGNVQMEELRGQLGDNLVGALEIVRKQLGYTGDKMNQFEKDVEQGRIKASQLVPALAKGLKELAAPGLAKALELLDRKQTRMVNAFNEFKNLIFTGGLGDGLGFLYESLEDILTATKPFAETLGFLLRGAIVALISPVRLLAALFHDLSVILDKIGNFFKIDNLTTKIMKLVGSFLVIKLAIKLWSRFLGILRTVAGFLGMTKTVQTVAKSQSLGGTLANTAKGVATTGAGAAVTSVGAAAGVMAGGMTYLDRLMKVYAATAAGAPMDVKLEILMKGDAPQFFEARVADKLSSSTQE